MRGVEMWWVGAGLVSGLDLVKVFEFFEAMFVDCADWFGKVSIHFMASDVEVVIIVVNDPGENWVLREIIVRTIRNDVDKVEILHIGNLAIGPHAHNIAQFKFHHFLSLLFQVPVHHLPG
jgi:hypothetical protein